MRRTIRNQAFLGAILAMAAALAARGATYFVAPDGTEAGDGTREKPLSAPLALKTVALKPGDEVVFLDGVYRFGADTKGGLEIKSEGTEEAPITYRAENRHGAILDGGTPLEGWQKADGLEGVWELRGNSRYRSLLVNGDSLLDATSRWRRDGKETLDEGMFAYETLEGGGFMLRIRPWAGDPPAEAYGLFPRLVGLAGAFNVMDGFVLRRAASGVHVGGRLVHTYRHGDTVYRDLGGLAYNTFGSFNILRNCIVRDMAHSALTSNESRFNLVEDCVVYNAGTGQGDHGIYVSQGAENLTLRRNVWWRTSGGAIHIYSGSGIDSPRNVTVEYNIFGPDKRNRCFPIMNRKSCAFYIWGGTRWAGGNRVTRNIVIGPHDRAISMHRCNFNLIANNTFLNASGATIQVGSGFGNVVANNIIEYSPGGQEAGEQERPSGYISFLDFTNSTALSTFRYNVLLPHNGEGAEIPSWMERSRLADADPFVDRDTFDFRLKAGSAAVDAGTPIPYLTGSVTGAAPDAGAVERESALYGEGAFPEIPRWLLEEWPISKRGQ